MNSQLVTIVKVTNTEKNLSYVFAYRGGIAKAKTHIADDIARGFEKAAPVSMKTDFAELRMGVGFMKYVQIEKLAEINIVMGSNMRKLVDDLVSEYLQNMDNLYSN